MQQGLCPVLDRHGTKRLTHSQGYPPKYGSQVGSPVVTWKSFNLRATVLGCNCRRSRLRDVDEAVVLDMGQFELPVPSLEKKTPMAQGPPNLAGTCVRFAWHLGIPGYALTAGWHVEQFYTR